MVVCTLGERKLAGWGLAFGRHSGHAQGPLRLCAAPTAAEVARIAEAAAPSSDALARLRTLGEWADEVDGRALGLVTHAHTYLPAAAACLAVRRRAAARPPAFALQWKQLPRTSRRRHHRHRSLLLSSLWSELVLFNLWKSRGSHKGAA